MKKEEKYNLQIVRNLSDLMNEKQIFSLSYETPELKIKLKSNVNLEVQNKNKFSNFPIKKEANTNINQIKEEPKINSEHPGAIKSPMVGTAYVSPEPGKKPFIQLGDQVEIGQPLVIIEAMKVMNTINSEKKGKVIFIGFEDAQPIEFEQLLVVIE